MKKVVVKKEEGYVPVVLGFTADYIMPVSVCLYSLLDSSKPSDKYHVVCLTSSNLPVSCKELLESLDNTGERVVYTFVDLKGDFMDYPISQTQFSVASAYRLLIPDILSEYDKAIYIDCDMIVRRNLAELYRSYDELGDNYLGASREVICDYQIPRMLEIGCDPAQYINTGFLFMNLEALRRDNMVPRFLEELKNEKYRYPDQDVLNLLCQGRISFLPPCYNSTISFFMKSNQEYIQQHYSQEEIDEISLSGNIHYIGKKPWTGYTTVFDKWWEYALAVPPEMRKGWRKDWTYRRAFLIYKVYVSVIGALLVRFIRKYRKQ